MVLSLINEALNLRKNKKRISFVFTESKLGWFGNLPGDLKIEKENVRIYFPVTTMLIVSIILSFLIWLFKKIF